MNTRAALLAVTIAALSAGTALAGATLATIAAGHTSLGTILVSKSNGRTLYLFEGDTKSKLACNGSCLKDWPPLEGAKATAVGGAKAGMIGLRPRGSAHQVTYNGHPLYYFSGDTKPGQATGEGLKLNGNLWYAVTPSGGAKIASTKTGSSSGGGGTPAW